MNMKSNGWLLGAACSVLLVVPSCAQVRDFYKETFTSKATYQDGSHTEAEKHGKTAPKETEPCGDQDPCNATDSNPFSLKWSW